MQACPERVEACLTKSGLSSHRPSAKLATTKTTRHNNVAVEGRFTVTNGGSWSLVFVLTSMMTAQARRLEAWGQHYTELADL